MILVGIVGSIFAVRAWYGTPQGRLAIDTLILKMPVLGI